MREEFISFHSVIDLAWDFTTDAPRKHEIGGANKFLDYVWLS